MKNKDKWTIGIFIVVIVILSIFIYIKSTSNNDKKMVSGVGDIQIDIDTDDGDSKIDWDLYEVKNIELSGNVNITSEGIYNLSGSISDGCITINTSGNVNLIFNNVSIINSNGPAIIVEEADNVLITLSDNTLNYLEDSSSYIGYDEDVNGVIYSKDDLIFDGSGILKIKANYQDGIVSKDDLKIINGTYVIDSNDDGIRGKDSVYIIDGNFTLNSLGDGIKSTNDTDTDKGFILIENGTFDIDSSLDGIDAFTFLKIMNGTFNIKTGGGSSNSSTLDTWGKWGYFSSNDTSSAKGIKAKSNLVIENGSFNLDTSDDAIHSNDYVGVKSGEFNISSGDDGIHADTEIIIDDCDINIIKSYEGIESAKITINGGNISVVASDDGINIAGGNDSSSMGRPGENRYSSNSDNILTINGGNIYVNSSSDGIDVNGSGYVYGGDITVDGPSDNGNGALDYDGEFIVNGGNFIAVGSSGMAQSISQNSTQYNVLINLTNSYTSGKKIEIIDSDGNVIISHTSIKSFNSIVVSSSLLKKTYTYKVKIDGEEYTSFTISDITTSIGNTGGMNGGRSGMRR